MSAVRARKGAADYGSYQQKRRDAALENQRSARRARTDLARSLHQLLQARGGEMEGTPGFDPLEVITRVSRVQGEEADAEIAEAEDGAAGEAGAGQMPAASRPKGRAPPHRINGMHPREFYAKQLMQPEWMTDIPADLGSSW